MFTAYEYQILIRLLSIGSTITVAGARQIMRAARSRHGSRRRGCRSAIPGARLLKIEGMGHDLPRGAWPQLIEAIVENTRRAGAPADDRQAA